MCQVKTSKSHNLCFGNLWTVVYLATCCIDRTVHVHTESTHYLLKARGLSQVHILEELVLHDGVDIVRESALKDIVEHLIHSTCTNTPVASKGY